MSMYVSWEELQSKMLREKSSFRKKSQNNLQARLEYTWGSMGGCGEGRQMMYPHFQNYSAITRTPSINSPNLTQMVYDPCLSLISNFNHHSCDSKDPRYTKKQTCFKPSQSYQAGATWPSLSFLLGSLELYLHHVLAFFARLEV